MSVQSKTIRKIVLIVGGNIILVGLLIMLFFLYKNDYEEKLFERNLNDIANINQGAASISAEIFTDSQRKLGDIVDFTKKNPLTLDQLLVFLNETNGESERNLQLVNKDSSGYYATPDENGEYAHLSYQSYSYADLQKVFNTASTSMPGVFLSVEFTDTVSHMRSFAVYSYIDVFDETGNSDCWTLMLVSQTSDFLDLVNVGVGFDKLSTVLIRSDGGYILRNSAFLSGNFYDYIGAYNDISLDAQKQIRNSVIKTGSGHLTYSDGDGKECVFAYTSIHDTSWYCITAVPVSSFHTAGLDMTFALLLLADLVALMLMNIMWLSHLNFSLKKSMQEARSASAAKTDFLSRMSHDIRTPLNAIIGTATLAKDELDNRAETEEALSTITVSGQFLLGLINDILDINKIESGNIELRAEPYRVDEFIATVNSTFLPLMEKKNLDFRFEMNCGHGLIMTDKLRYNQIFFNLLSNAVKYTPAGGKVEFFAEPLDAPEGVAGVRSIVRDNGIGMSEEYLKHLYEPFTRDSNAAINRTEGTGLGLAIVKSIVTAMGGTISVKSEKGKGTEFTVDLRLPIAKAEDVKANEEVSFGDEVLEGLQVLLVEDNSTNVKIARKMLEKKKSIVTVASNGEEAVSTFAASAENSVDVILMDIRMPVMDGLTATRIIRAMNRQDAKTVPIIAMTANAYSEDEKKSLEAGMNAHLAKPIEPQQLFKTIESYVNKRK